MVNRKVVCLGGGIGTVNLIRGLRDYFADISVVVSMADDGGSAGRLRRLYNIPPPGDLVSCMSALIKKDNPNLVKLLTYRFKGDRYGKDKELGGQKLGNLVLTAMLDITGSFKKAIELFKKTFDVAGSFLPATTNAISISARTIEGKIIYGEEKIDRGQYRGKRVLERIFLHPKDAKANPLFIKSIEKADIIIAGPGDLYTTILPVLTVSKVKDVLEESKAVKVFVVNVTNKPFETKGYAVKDYIDSIKRHLGTFPFNKIVVNNNCKPIIPSRYNYKYVDFNGTDYSNIQVIKADLIYEEFPLYHDSEKLAKTIVENI